MHVMDIGFFCDGLHLCKPTRLGSIDIGLKSFSNRLIVFCDGNFYGTMKNLVDLFRRHQ